MLCAALAAAPCVVRAQSSSPSLAPAASASPAPASSTRPWTAPALARPPSRADLDEARRRFQHGVDLGDGGNFGAALEEFTRAYLLTRNARVLFNISASNEALGNVIDALDALRAFETLAPGDVMRRQRAALAAAETRLQNRVGTLVVESSVPDIEIRLDGVQLPAAALREGMRIAAGRHHLALSAPGFAPREQDVEVPGNAAQRETAELVRLRSHLAVDCNLPGATVTVDDAAVGATPLTGPLDVSQGLHRVRVQRPGYSPYETEVTVGAEGAHVAAQLAWADAIAPEVASRLLVQLPEAGARTTLDGRGIGMDGTDRLPPGVHRLRIEHRDRVPLEHEITLAAGRQSSVDATLALTLDARQDRIGRVRLYGWLVGGAGAVLFLGFGTWFVVNEFRGSPSTQEEFRIASASVAGVGFAGLAAGLGVLVAAPHMDVGPREPTFRFRAGLGSVGAEFHF